MEQPIDLTVPYTTAYYRQTEAVNKLDYYMMNLIRDALKNPIKRPADNREEER